ncbi:glycosyltransferase family 2 protein [Echinicola sp. 20G]|uniref:glycosyltransferase family 2 protein n=1 Tax=Echinicola sp. 20G TaxID=2781961 RepID=UPI0019108E46|nr:glycosyltransferase [Echinicola sp. 20G]
MKINLYIPTLNAGNKWPQVIESINRQSLSLHRKVIIDSGSTDQTLSAKFIEGFDVIKIDKKDFDHGGTRQLAVETYPDAAIFVFLTQDAILADHSAIEKLVQAFENNPNLGVAYGRQLPHLNAKTLESHARLFNYPAHSETRSFLDAGKYGIKTISCSNSFAAYRKEAFLEVGGFPKGLILGEDAYIAGKMILAGWDLAYVSDSKVHHSHNYSVKEEFKRYFDIGVFHAESDWIFENFGRAESRGMQYLQSELSYALKNNPVALPKSIASLFAKWAGYKIGLKHNKLPLNFKRKLSMHSRFWHSTY